jgi:transposase
LSCEDIAFRVLSAISTPDHVTIARFRVRHEQALAGLLVRSLTLCAAAGLVLLGLIYLDGIKVAANAAARGQPHPRQPYRTVTGLLEQAAQADRAEDAHHG